MNLFNLKITNSYDILKALQNHIEGMTLKSIEQTIFVRLNFFLR